jgi:cyclic dehypoxanthinyl futalosine synthase
MERINNQEAIELYKNSNLLELGEIANNIRGKLHPKNIVTYVIDRNINYTNICSCKCKFCGFYRDIEDDEGYVIDFDLLSKKIQETIDLGGTQLLLQGGLHPELKIDFYENMFKFIKDNFDIWIHGLSAPEIVHIAKISDLDINTTLKRLIDAGLDSIPGAGAELLVDSERQKISPNKINSADWLKLMEIAHNEGLKTTATMMFKKTDPIEFIVEHLEKIRSLQDKTGGFTAFIPWAYQPDNTELGGEHATAVEYLKILAFCRIYLDNIKNIQVSWVTQGDKIGQTALYFGGNDFGSLMIEENVVAACGAIFKMTEDEIRYNITKAGFIPAQRDMEYNLIG